MSTMMNETLAGAPAQGAAPVVEARNIMMEYDGETILAGCDLAVSPGEFVAVVGASGEGKSTLLSVLGLLLTPSAGKVYVNGKDISGLADTELSRVRAEAFGFVFQHTQLVGSLRAIDNVLVPACFGGSDMQTASQRAAQLVSRFGLENRVNHFPYQLSVGQKRRVALARAMVLSPQLLIADEPTNDLDDATAAVVVQTLRDFAAEGHAVLCVTHDAALAKAASRVLRLENGKLSEVDANDVREVRRVC